MPRVPRTAGLFLFVCLTSKQHEKCISRTDFTGKFTCCHTEKWRLKLAISPSHGTLTPGQAVPTMTPWCLASSKVANYQFFSFSFFFFLFFFFYVPQLYLWGSLTILGEICAYLPFFNPTIELATFCLRGWCKLGVFLLKVYARVGHERQDLWSPCDGNASAHRLDFGLYSHPKEFWGNGVGTHVGSKGKAPSTGKILPREASNPRRCIKQDSEPNTLPTSCSSSCTNVSPLHTSAGERRPICRTPGAQLTTRPTRRSLACKKHKLSRFA